MNASFPPNRVRLVLVLLQIAGTSLSAGIIYKQGLSNVALYCVGFTILSVLTGRMMFLE